MTIVVTLNDGEKLLSISDGMISRQSGGKSSNVLSQVQKFICFRPCIKVASFNMGRVDSIQRSHLQEIYLAYAGNYSTISAIASEFGSILNSQLFALPDHDVSKKVIFRDRTMAPFQVGDRAFDDLKGHKFPLAKFGVAEAASLIDELVLKHASDFAFQQMTEPDVEIQLFGCGDHRPECVELHCKGLSAATVSGQTQGPQAEVKIQPIERYRLSILGNAAIKNELHEKFGPQLKAASDEANHLDETVDELFDMSGAYKRLDQRYREIAREVESYTLSIISRNERGVGGEAKVLHYRPAGGYSVQYYPSSG